MTEGGPEWKWHDLALGSIQRLNKKNKNQEALRILMTIYVLELFCGI